MRKNLDIEVNYKKIKINFFFYESQKNIQGLKMS